MKNIALALLTLALLPATLFAGGGTKSSAELVIKNTSTSIVFVIVDTTLSDTQLAAITDPNAFTAAGGIILQPGASSKPIKVKVGHHTVKAAFPIDATTNATTIGPITTATVHVIAHKTTTVTVSRSMAGTPIISVAP